MTEKQKWKWGDPVKRKCLPAKAKVHCDCEGCTMMRFAFLHQLSQENPAAFAGLPRTNAPSTTSVQ